MNASIIASQTVIQVDRSKDNLVRLTGVRARTGLSRTTIYRKIAAGTFPGPIRISEGCSAWYESDLDQWVADPQSWKVTA